MRIREAEASDIPKMVEVLRASMGNFDLPVSENIWEYKHVNNPFGKSLVLVAEENNEVVGVRAFMRWQWQLGGKKMPACRAVDTATHPGHQGKGIFKKLTLTAVEIAKEQGVNLIFNTPNDKSRPGYLKMGWKPVEKLKVGLKPAYNSFWKLYKNDLNYNVLLHSTELKRKELCSNWNNNLQVRASLFTPKSVEFLRWRYEDNPLQQYEVIANEDFYLATYVKKRKGIKELRVAECIFLDQNTATTVKRSINDMASKFGVQVISFAPQLLSMNAGAIKGNFGPVLTLRELNLTPKERDDFGKLDSWNYSLGDLELF